MVNPLVKSKMATLSFNNCVRGHHVNKSIWTPFLEEQVSNTPLFIDLKYSSILYLVFTCNRFINNMHAPLRWYIVPQARKTQTFASINISRYRVLVILI